ncbi:MAG: peptidoglycan editing factor PgeF [Candidatus Binataceae bacterium]|jgi:YfiH family protein
METALPTAVAPPAPPILSPWDLPRVRAGFMGRRGGVSTGAYASLNLAHWLGDDLNAVAENWRRWRGANPALRPAILHQVHAATVLRVNDGDAILNGVRPRADGMIATATGIALCTFTADCVPILLADEEAHVAAALHAGWRGTLANIAGAGIEAMVRAGARPDRMRAAAGPSIGPCCFEVDAELAEEFTRQIAVASAHTRPGRSGKAFIDLRGIVDGQLKRAGLDPSLISSIGPCTKCHPEDYFSRRAAGGVITGLQMSFIGFSD